MIERQSGVILHISSIQHRLPLYDSTLAYAAAKGALNPYNKGLANEVGPKGMRVNMISPGLIETSGAHGMIVALAKSKGNRPRRHALPHTERNESTRVPEGRNPRYRLSRSSRHTCSMILSGTFPGGSGQETDAGRLFKGGVRTPRATIRCSCSEWPSRRQGTIRATGLLRSHTSTSSPSRTS
jgi:Enoyl-(Acyl carrier protein) reductase